MTHVTSPRQVTNNMTEHHYKIVYKDRSIVVESWDEVQEWWWNNCINHYLMPLYMLLTNQRLRKSPKDFNYENKRRTCDRVL